MPAAPTAPLSERWFRETPDSARLPRPRLLTRSLIHLRELDEQIRLYEELTGTPADLRMPIPDFGGLELAAVGSMLLIASIRPFTDIQRRTTHSLIVPSLKTQLDRLRDTAATVLEPPETILPGSRARVRYADGTIAELVEHRPQPGERPRPRRQAAPPDGAPRLLVRRAVSARAFPAAVAQYESILGTGCDTHLRLHGVPPIQLATVGNLLIVGTDGPEYTRSADVGLALVTTGPLDSTHLRSEPAAQRRAGPARDRHHLVELRGGTLAEVWDTSVGLHHPAAPVERGPRTAEAGTP
ncbi:lactoylglutathione lyase [Streptomyces sp. NPDC096095]|uniref:lactoylglutathione lyase n=1 Tax=Streptomyces sp. NPDC096095 TaxID=3155545 RepID=UPI003320BADE